MCIMRASEENLSWCNENITLIIVKDKDFLKKGTMHNFISFKHRSEIHPF